MWSAGVRKMFPVWRGHEGQSTSSMVDRAGMRSLPGKQSTAETDRVHVGRNQTDVDGSTTKGNPAQ